MKITTEEIFCFSAREIGDFANQPFWITLPIYILAGIGVCFVLFLIISWFRPAGVFGK